MSSSIIEGAYRIKYLPTQQEVINAIRDGEATDIMYCGGFGCGKSRFAGEIAWELSLKYPGIGILFWRKTRVSLADTTYRIFLEQVIPEEYILSHNKSKMSVIDHNGSRYDFLGLDKVSRKGSYWGDVAIIDESIELSEEELKMIEGRLRGQIIPQPLMIYLTNPGMPGTYQHRKFVVNETLPEDQRDRETKYFSATSYENINNPPAYFKRLRKWEGTQYYNRYVLSQWVGFEGLVYSMFGFDRHIIKPFDIPKSWTITLAVDYGYFPNPMVILWIAYDPSNDINYVFRQMYMTRVLVRDATKLVSEMCLKTGEVIEDIYDDHDAENRAQFEHDLMATTAARKEVLAGIQTVQEALLDDEHTGRPKVYIFNNEWSDKENTWYGLIEEDPYLKESEQPVCLQEELIAYMWGDDGKPVKEKDHACDALRYNLHTRRIESGKEIIGDIIGISKEKTSRR